MLCVRHYKEKAMSTIDYKEHLLKELRDGEYAAGYLTAAREEGEDVLLLAMRDVAQSHGGMDNLNRGDAARVRPLNGDSGE